MESVQSLDMFQFHRNIVSRNLIENYGLWVASPGIEPGSGASETLILSIVRQGLLLFAEINNITTEYFYGNGQQYYAEKFADNCQAVWA